jgi:hypothetical protein
VADAKASQHRGKDKIGSIAVHQSYKHDKRMGDGVLDGIIPVGLSEMAKCRDDVIADLRQQRKERAMPSASADNGERRFRHGATSRK